MKNKSTLPAYLHSPFGISIALALLFLFRLIFGICSDIATNDPRQIYLIGLKYYCTGSWPYFGPDVVDGMQIPGALQGLVVGLPLRVFPVPEAPYLFLNCLSFGSLALLAWYYSKRLPEFPRWFLWGWLMIAPWTLNCSTNIYNVSYILFGSVLFFIGFLEALPSLSLGIFPAPLCFFMMGFALFWNAQFHLSYVILLPFLLFALLLRVRFGGGPLAESCLYGLLGALLSGSFLIPTYLKYGLHQGVGGTQNALLFNPSNFSAFFTILARYFSLASCEFPRFIGAHTADRLAFLKTYPWVAPFALIGLVLGTLQPLVMLFSGVMFFRGAKTNHSQKDWPAVTRLAWLTFLLIFGSFLFAFKAPAAHTYFVALPVVMLYAFYVFQPWTSRGGFQLVAKTLLVCDLIFHAGLAYDNLKNRSLCKERTLFTEAIAGKNYHLVGERLPHSLY